MSSTLLLLLLKFTVEAPAAATYPQKGDRDVRVHTRIIGVCTPRACEIQLNNIMRLSRTHINETTMKMMYNSRKHEVFVDAYVTQ